MLGLIRALYILVAAYSCRFSLLVTICTALYQMSSETKSPAAVINCLKSNQKNQKQKNKIHIQQDYCWGGCFFFFFLFFFNCCIFKGYRTDRYLQHSIDVPSQVSGEFLCQNGNLQDNFFLELVARFAEMLHVLIHNFCHVRFVAQTIQQIDSSFADGNVRVCEKRLNGSLCSQKSQAM